MSLSLRSLAQCAFSFVQQSEQLFTDSSSWLRTELKTVSDRVVGIFKRVCWEVEPLVVETAKPVKQALSPFCFMQADDDEVLALQGSIENTNVHHSVPCLEEIKKKGFLATYKIVVGNATFYCSKPMVFTKENSRVGVFTLVVLSGKAYPRVLYCSKSQAIWRVLPEVVKIEREASGRCLGHFGKGLAEVDTNVPQVVSIALSELVQKQSVFAVLEEEGLNSICTAQFCIASYPEEYRLHHEQIRDAAAEPTYTLKPQFSELSEAQTPNFSSCIYTFSSWSPLYGDMKGYVYYSNDKKLSYLFYEVIDPQACLKGESQPELINMKGLVFLAGYELLTTNSGAENPITSFGNRKYFHRFSFLDLSLFEYPGQIPRIAKVKSSQVRLESYASTWHVLRKNPHIRMFYKIHAKKMPKSV